MFDHPRTAAPPPEETLAADPVPPVGSPAVPGYDILGVLGRGGMGVVYKARQPAVNRVVALKMLPAGADPSPSTEARFQIEAEAVAALQHPGIVQLFEFGEIAGERFLSLEYVPGGTLAQRMAKKPFTPRVAAELVINIADAVHAAHQKGVIHRDLKPGNVLLTEAGEPKVTDFGLARIGRSELTVSGAILGTPSYMSPEQAAGDAKRVGTPADVWALGAILYELLTGRVPFRRDTIHATLHAVVNDAPDPVRRHNRRVSRDLETICLKCLQKDPADRYRTADALAADLRAYLGGFPVAARPVGFVRRTWKLVKRNPIRSALFAILLVGGVWIGASLPRMTATIGTDAQPSGVRVNSDSDTADAFYTADQKVYAYTYSGKPVDFWLELERKGQPMETLRAVEWDTDPVAPIREAQGKPVSGRWVWVRGERDKDGTEVWLVGLKRSIVKPATTALPAGFGGSLANAFGSSGATVEQTETDTSYYKGRRTVSFGKHPHGPNGSTWSFGSGMIVNPIAEDRPVCLKEIEGGWGEGDGKTTEYTVRIMCQVLTPELAERRMAEREEERKREAGKE